MPTVTLDKTVFEKLVGKKLPLEQLQDRISMLGTDLEKIEGDEIHVEIFPNRPDMLSEAGLARAVSSFIGVKTGLRKYSVKKSGCKVIVDKSVAMRPYTACAIVKNITFTDERIREIMQVQEKLSTTHGRRRKKSEYGLYPLEKINFPITYIAKDPKTMMFRPLGFQQEIRADQVEELHPTGKEFKSVAEGWKKYPFFIDSKGKVLSMLPYTNSEDLGKVELSTRDVFIECTGVDLQNVIVALNILTTTLADLGGEIYSLDIVYPHKTITTPDLSPRKKKVELSYFNTLLGLELSEKDLKHYLERMGYGYERGTALIPAYRADILHQADLAEDIAIAYGYENFEEIIPNVATIGEEDPLKKFSSKIREVLLGLSLLEIKNYHLMTKEELNEKCCLNNTIIPLKNSLGEYNHLRNALLPSALKTLAANQHNEYPQNIFELGRVFQHDSHSETGIAETEHLSIALCHETADFTQIRQVLEALISSLGLKLVVKETKHSSFIAGRAGEILIDQHRLGIIGEIHPQVLNNWNLTIPIVALELDLEKLRELVSE